MGLFVYFRAVWRRAWHDAWRAVINHSLKTLARDGAFLAFLIFFGFLWQRQLVASGVMSADNFKDSVVWIGLGILAALTVFTLWFFVEGLFLVPYKMWKEAKEAPSTGDTLVATGELGPALPPMVSEGADKDAARTKLVVAAREYFDPAQMALLQLYAESRDAFQRKIGSGPTAGAIGQGIDRKYSHADAPPIMSLAEFQNPNKIKRMTLHQVQSDYYTNYCRYVESIRLTWDLMDKAAPLHAIFVDKLRGLHSTWKIAHEAVVGEHVRLGREDQELGTIAHMSKMVPLALPPDPDWSKLTAANP